MTIAKVVTFTPTCDACGRTGKVESSNRLARLWMARNGWGQLTGGPRWTEAGGRPRGVPPRDLCPTCIPGAEPPEGALVPV